MFSKKISGESLLTLSKESKGCCEECEWCGLVIDNHDYDMAMECAKILSGSSIYERAIEFLHSRSKSVVIK